MPPEQTGHVNFRNVTEYEFQNFRENPVSKVA